MHKKKDTPEAMLKEELKDLSKSLRVMDPANPAYQDTLKNLERVTELQKELNACKPKVSPDAILGFIANIGGIALVLQHEKLNVITSKAFNMVSRVKIGSFKK